MNDDTIKQFSIVREALEKCIRHIRIKNFESPDVSSVAVIDHAEEALEALIEKPQEQMQLVVERMAYICKSCEGVYADAPVTQCDCMPDTDEFIEGTITYPSALANPASAAPVDNADFYRGVIAALGALAPHSTHGCTEHDEIVRSVGKEQLYAAAEPEDVAWAGLDPEFYAAQQSAAPKGEAA
jgi:hypothetical protein